MEELTWVLNLAGMGVQLFRNGCSILTGQAAQFAPDRLLRSTGIITFSSQNLYSSGTKDEKKMIKDVQDLYKS